MLGRLAISSWLKHVALEMVRDILSLLRAEHATVHQSTVHTHTVGHSSWQPVTYPAVGLELCSSIF